MIELVGPPGCVEISDGGHLVVQDRDGGMTIVSRNHWRALCVRERIPVGSPPAFGPPP